MTLTGLTLHRGGSTSVLLAMTDIFVEKAEKMVGNLTLGGMKGYTMSCNEWASFKLT